MTKKDNFTDAVTAVSEQNNSSQGESGAGSGQVSASDGTIVTLGLNNSEE